ncbi:5-formyltetrahydrofolate cyclo-ligase [Parabacteroides sp. AF14-59]|uniref:5-formyltetrahydrofolate cyclo-ligase n=1 Tax=Parabacteroides TaxID=375288 RepID=UPI003519EA1E
MASLKSSYEKTTLLDFSETILKQLEETELFRQASCVALYNAIPGEVQTATFLEKWYDKKQLLLPLVVGNDLRLLPYEGIDTLKPGIFGILEPADQETTIPETDIDLIIVPGVAFDRQLNRMGRGKGYYDRLLSTLQAPKIGICFDFQLQEMIPVEPFDKKMDMIITEKEVITG